MATDLADEGVERFLLRDLAVGEFLVIDGRIKVSIEQIYERGGDRVKVRIDGTANVETAGVPKRRKPRDRRFRRVD